MQAQRKFLFCFVKLIKYIFSVYSACLNPCVGPLPKIKISFFLLSIFVNEVISTPQIFKFLSVPPEFLHLSISEFLAKLSATNKQFPRV